jgi:hypothetical protein
VPEPSNPTPELEPIQPVPRTFSTFSITPPVAPFQPQKIVIDWGTEPILKEEENVTAEAHDAHEVVAETPHAEAEAGELKMASPESTDTDSDEEKIHLRLAAILRQCPREILVGELPQVDDSVRITLPFAPIDRQLVKGRVEMSALRFILALPEVYQKHFVAKVGVKVTIPLEEVFQNLPTPKKELIPQPPVPPPVVLAPAVPVASVPPQDAEPATQKPTPAPAAATPSSVPVAPAPVAIEAKISGLEPTPVVTVPAHVAPPPAAPSPSPVIVPAETPKAEAPVAPALSREEPPVVAAPVAVTAVAPVGPSTELPVPVIRPVIRPIIGTPEASTAEKMAQPPLPTPAEIAVSAVEPEHVPSVAAAASAEVVQDAVAESVSPKSSTVPEPAHVTTQAAPPIETTAVPAPTVVEVPLIGLSPASQETLPVAPVIEPVVSSAFVTSAEVNAPPSADAPKLRLQPPFFRPQFAPPPIFGVTPPTVAPEPEPPSRPEPPSVLAGLAEAAAVAHVAAAAPAVPKEEPTPSTAPSAAVESPAVAAISPAPVEVKPVPAAEAASEAEPSAEMIALAGEHEAPDIAHFSSEPVPFADLTETLAHETTYASDLAQVVHVDAPAPEPAETKTSAVALAPAEQPMVETKPVEIAKPEEADEHRPVTIGEGLAAAAVAATITDHVPLDFREVLTTAEEVKTPEETAAPGETSAVKVEVKAGEPKPAATVATGEVPEILKSTEPSESVAPPVEAATLGAGKTEEAAATPALNVGQSEGTSAVETPIVLTPVSPAAPAVVVAATPAAPPPHPLFPLPKVPAEPAHVEVLPPPSLPLRRFDQDAIQTLFMTEETLDLPKISRLAAALPGVYACVIATRDQACTGGNLPEGFDLAALLGLAPRVGEAAGRMPIGQLKHFTLYGDAYSVSFFERNGLSLCAVHRPRSFVPGVREKLVALADELSR